MTLCPFRNFSITLWSHAQSLFATTIFTVVHCVVFQTMYVVTVQFAGSTVQIVQIPIGFFLVLNYTFCFMTLPHSIIQLGWILFGIILVRRVYQPSDFGRIKFIWVLFYSFFFYQFPFQTNFIFCSRKFL